MLARVAIATLLLLAAVTAPLAQAKEGSRFREAAKSELGMVATESAAASRVGRAVLKRGGNAIDAAVATTFAVGVARPQSCGIGGGGFMVYRRANGSSTTLDFRETAPAAITPQSFQGPGPHEDFTGYRTIGVPGTVAGMASALRRYGSLDFDEAIAPAERLAQRGFRVPASTSADMKKNAERLKLFPAAAAAYLKNGSEPYAAGERFANRDLARTLRLLMRSGPDAFYRGSIARRLALDVRTASKPPGDVGVLTQKDLAAYGPIWRRALVGEYRGRTVTAMPPPTSGGIAVLEMLNILEGFDMKALGLSSGDSLHYLAEAQKIAWADRGRYVADPLFVRVPTGELVSKQYAAGRRAQIQRDRAGRYQPGSFATAGSSDGATQAGASAKDERSASTTHISVIDSDGNAVSLTCTIEQTFGSAVVVPGLGFLLNNELTDFGDPGTANEAKAGKRPRSSMSPTIVSRGRRPILVTGGAGGARIIMGTLHAVVNTVDYGLDPARAVDAERIDAAAVESGVEVEEARLLPGVVDDLRRRGHDVKPQGEYDDRPRVQAAGLRLTGRELLGASDSRSEWAALGVGPRRR